MSKCDGVLILVVASVLGLSFCQIVPQATISGGYTALVPVTIRCINDRNSGLRCNAEYPDQCKEQWKFPNPCTQINLSQNRTRFVHPFDTTKFLMCGELGKLYVVQCPQHEVYHEGCGQCIGEGAGLKLTASCEYPLPTVVNNPCSREAILANKLFFGFPGNITKFIHCDIWGKAWERICTPGEVWSQFDVACVNPALMNPCNRRVVGPSVLFPHPCNPLKYLRCGSNGEALEVTCDNGTAFSAVNQSCISVFTYTGSIDNICEGFQFGFKPYVKPTAGITVPLSSSGGLGLGSSVVDPFTGLRGQTGIAVGGQSGVMTVGQVTGNTGGTASQITGSLGGTGSQGTSFLGGAVGQVNSNMGRTVGQGTSVLGGTVGQGTSVLGGTVGQGTSVLGGTVGQGTSVLGGTVGQGTSVLGGTVGQGTNALGGTVGQVTSNMGGTFGQMTSSMGGTVGQGTGVLGGTNVVQGTGLMGGTSQTGINNMVNGGARANRLNEILNIWRKNVAINGQGVTRLTDNTRRNNRIEQRQRKRRPKQDKKGKMSVETVHPSQLKEYVFSNVPYSEPCTVENLSNRRTHFRLKGDPHVFLQCDNAGRMYEMPCSTNKKDWFDVYTMTCVDGPVHVDNRVPIKG